MAGDRCEISCCSSSTSETIMSEPVAMGPGWSAGDRAAGELKTGRGQGLNIF